MSIDVFGRHLDRTAAASRGPPGVGFKVTSDGQYDVDGKRLCNVTDAKEQYDAVNLGLVQRIIQNEIRTVNQVTSSMRADVDNNNLMIRILEETINEKLKNLQIDIEQDLSIRNTEIIAQLDARLNALENEQRKVDSSHRAA